MSPLRALVATFLVTGLLLGAAAWWKLDRLQRAALPLAEPRVVMVAPGLSVRAIGRVLAADGIVADADDLLWATRIWGHGPVKAGEYEVQPGGSVVDLLRQLESGAVVLHPFTIIEGTTLAELRANLERNDDMRHTLEGIADRDLMVALGLPAGPAEGRFLPDTYRFPRGTTDAEFLRRANRALVSALDSAWARHRAGLPYPNPDALLTLASLVERETGIATERRQIAGVFVRRIERGIRLQSDPTVIYGLGARFDGNLRKQDLMTDTPYNTYTRRGLPPTPICLPSRAALEAAADPAPGSALYFVASGDGGHVFSTTLVEHNAAVQRYLKRLREQRRSGR